MRVSAVQVTVSATEVDVAATQAGAVAAGTPVCATTDGQADVTPDMLLAANRHSAT